MKIFISLFMLCTGVLTVHSQSTWLKPLVHWSNGGWGWADHACGLIDAANAPDSTVYLVTKINPGYLTMLYKYDWKNQDTIWSYPIGGKCGAFCTRWCDFVKATADSGCITATNRPYLLGGGSEACILKFSKTGQVQWADTFSVLTLVYPWINDIIINNAGNYYAVLSNTADTLLEYDASGNILSVMPLPVSRCRRIRQTANGDLLILCEDSLFRWQFSGNTPWSVPVERFELSAWNDDFTFLCDSDQAFPIHVARMVDAVTGNVVWADTVPYLHIASVTATADRGAILGVGQFLALGLNGTPPDTLTGHVIKLDSLGNVEWDQAYGFSEFGFHRVVELAPGFYMTAGTHNANNMWSVGGATSPNAFLATLDSAGNGLIQTTSYMWPGDANHNDTILATEDILYTVQALGSTGPVRNTPSPPVWGLLLSESSFAFDWTGKYPNGVNHKHADFDNSGTVDNADIQQYFTSTYPFYGLPVSYYRPCQPAPGPESSATPEVGLIPAKDTVAPGDTMRFYLVAGTAGMPFDSLCGLALHAGYPDYLVDTAFFNAVFYNNVLGDTAVNLLTASGVFPGDYLVMACRTDHQNVFQFADTLGFVELRANPNITTLQLFDYWSADAYAITGSAYRAGLTLNTPSVVIAPPLTTGASIPGPGISLFPNPADEALVIDHLPVDALVSVFDVLGNCVTTADQPHPRVSLKTASWPDGLYILRIQSSTRDSHYLRFVVQHE